jgi:hypothetical protein
VNFPFAPVPISHTPLIGFGAMAAASFFKNPCEYVTSDVKLSKATSVKSLIVFCIRFFLNYLCNKFAFVKKENQNNLVKCQVNLVECEVKNSERTRTIGYT